MGKQLDPLASNPGKVGGKSMAFTIMLVTNSACDVRPFLKSFYNNINSNGVSIPTSLSKSQRHFYYK